MVYQDMFNSADYAYFETSSQDIILRWEEMRDIFAIVIYSTDTKSISDVKI